MRELINSLCKIYSIFTRLDVQSICAQKGAQQDMSTQEVFVQQFARLFHHYREALSPEAEQESATLNAIPTDERRRLVEAARLAILELETNAHKKKMTRVATLPNQEKQSGDAEPTRDDSATVGTAGTMGRVDSQL